MTLLPQGCPTCGDMITVRRLIQPWQNGKTGVRRTAGAGSKGGSLERKDVDYASGGREPPKSFDEYQECQQDPCDTLQLQ